MFPIPVWLQGTLQPSTPVNEAFLRMEILQRGATSILSTPPGSPADGQVHIVGASPTGAWSTFSQNDVVLWRSGTWYRFAPFLGWLKSIGGNVFEFDGSEWVETGGSGGGVEVRDEGSTVTAAAPAINFTGGGVSVTEVGGIPTVVIPGDGADWNYLIVASDVTTTSVTAINVPGLSVSPQANKIIVVEGLFLTRSAQNTTGCRPGLNWPTIQDGVLRASHGQSSAAAQDGNANSATASYAMATSAMPNSTTSWPFWFSLTMVCGPSPSESLQFTLQSETAGSEVQIRTGSWIRWRAIN